MLSPQRKLCVSELRVATYTAKKHAGGSDEEGALCGGGRRAASTPVPVGHRGKGSEAGPGTELPCAAGKHPGGPGAPAGGGFVTGRRSHLLLAVGAEKQLLAGGEEAPAKRWVLGGQCRRGSAPETRRGLIPSTLTRVQKPPPKETERNV